MKLSVTDLTYINHRMETYDIKYREIYDEITDHVISAIETMRAKGDNRNIATLFDEMMEKQFPGYYAFKKIASHYQKAYDVKIRKMLAANFRYYLNVPALITILLLCVIGFYLPQNKPMAVSFMIAMVLVALTPQFYVYLKTNKINSTKGKRSIVKQHVRYWSTILIIVNNLILNCIGFLGKEYKINFLNPIYFHPTFYILLLSAFTIYALSSMRLCRQELRLDEAK